MVADQTRSLSVLRIYHSAVVTGWRERDRQLRRLGARVMLVSAERWNEGGADVAFDPAGDHFVRPTKTWGRHPYCFLYDPRAIYRALRHHHFDVVDVHEEPASLAAFEVLVVRLLARRRAPILFYGAQNIEKRFPAPFRWIERWSMRAASGAHCCNDAAGEIFLRKGMRGTVRTLGLGVDLDAFCPGDEPPQEPFRVGYVGRIERRKGVETLVSAMAKAPGCELHLFGEGPFEPDLQAHARRLGVADRVHLHGHRTGRGLAEAYRSVHVLGVPSRTTRRWVEQFGRVIIEAMACGVPVIGSDSGAIPEVIGEAGIVVPEADISAWAHAIGTLRCEPEKRRALRIAGLQRAQRYGWRAIAHQQLALYHDVTAGRAVAAAGAVSP